MICFCSVGADVGSFCWGSRLTSSDLLGFKPEICVLWVRNPDLRFYNRQIDAFTKTRKRV
ncbi:hypothetical protein HanXRQr2_Chr04g0167091 [Helianthus annuus]|nr:hypothetical protein HanXRQr2_Chr04g0167091 [Helianthus annuus]KAJ0931337.1 hypothetical protein HanPSC8_Chr04g0160481 [Helianthus annuus]